jgi:hypothetical protein
MPVETARCPLFLEWIIRERRLHVYESLFASRYIIIFTHRSQNHEYFFKGMDISHESFTGANVVVALYVDISTCLLAVLPVVVPSARITWPARRWDINHPPQRLCPTCDRHERNAGMNPHRLVAHIRAMKRVLCSQLPARSRGRPHGTPSPRAHPPGVARWVPARGPGRILAPHHPGTERFRDPPDQPGCQPRDVTFPHLAPGGAAS